MSCSQCVGIERLFDKKVAARELKRYRKKGPSKTTGMVLSVLKLNGIRGKTLLDIGGGVGAIQHELIKAGIEEATGVDASSAYLDAAREEAQRQGHIDRMRFFYGDFVEVADDISPADIVTLDRVICCYPDARQLVLLSLDRAQKWYALVFPRDALQMKIFRRIANFTLRLKRSPFRIYIHATEEVRRLVESRGFVERFYQKTFLWQVMVYQR